MPLPEAISPATQCVHYGYDPREHHHSANPPIYLTSTFEFDHAQDCADAFAGHPQPGQTHIYTRLSNPTNEILEKRLACLERAEAAVTMSSGMGAIASVFWTFLSQNTTIISSNRVYGCTYALIAHQLTRFGINSVFVDMTDINAVETAIKTNKNIKIIYTESIQNPTSDVVDMEKLAALAHAAGARLVVDNTFATPLGCRPLQFGADIVLHSATKYLIGGVCTAGCVMGTARDMNDVRFIGLKDCTGAVLDPAMAFAMIQGLETLDLRVRRMSESSIKLARFFEQHPKVERVVCTGLESHPQLDLCKKYIEIPNGLFSIYLKGGYAECCKLMNRLNITMRAVSLGKTHSLANHPASMTHSTYTPEERQKYGISDNLIRISVGVEDVDDLIADWKQALE